MKLIVGLGNSGAKYENTRHNIGFMVIDKLADSLPTTDYSKKGRWKIMKKLQSAVCSLPQAILAKPQTFMNRSGIAISALAHFYRIDPSQIIIVHDDLDLSFGKIRIQRGGTSAGHKGIASIIDFLRTDDFVRIRVGIGRPNEGEDPERYVLSKFLPQEKKDLPAIVKKACQAIEYLLQVGVHEAQNRFN